MSKGHLARPLEEGKKKNWHFARFASSKLGMVLLRELHDLQHA